MSRTSVTEIPLEKRREILEKHQDTKRIEIGDIEIPVFLGGASFDFAEQEDIPLSKIMQDMMDEQTDPQKNIESVVDILYVGTLPFGTDVNRAEIKLRLSLESLEDIVSQIFPEVEDLAEEEMSGKDLGSPEKDSGDTATKSARSRGNSPAFKS